MSNQLFFAFSAILVLAASLGSVFRFFRFPLILAYILAGALISFFGLGQTSLEPFEFFSQIGIALLLFIVGAELNLFEIKKLAKVIVWGATLQIILTFALFFLLARFLGFGPIEAFYIGLGFSFSSTIVVVKMLSERRDQGSLYGKLTIGFLILQDLLAIVSLIILASFGGSGGFSPGVLLKGVGLLVLLLFFWRLAQKVVLRYLSSNLELLFLSSIAFCLLLSSLAKILGFSFEIGAFLAGLLVGSSSYQLAILSKVKPLRDFFLVLFFILFGLKITISDLALVWPALVAFSALIIFGKAVIVFLTLSLLQEAKRTAFLVAISLSQISEFSLILVLLGRNLGQVDDFLVSFVSSAAIISIFFSSLIAVSQRSIYKFIIPLLKVFEREKARARYTTPENLKLEDHVIVAGCDRMGRDLLEFLKKHEATYVILDFNPQIYERLRGEEVPVIFGDVTDPEILEQLNVKKAKVLVSTIPDFEDTAVFISQARKEGFLGPIIATSQTNEEALKLYRLGADFVVLPHIVGGKHLAYLLGGQWSDLGRIKEHREQHMKELE